MDRMATVVIEEWIHRRVRINLTVSSWFSLDMPGGTRIVAKRTGKRSRKEVKPQKPNLGNGTPLNLLGRG